VLTTFVACEGDLKSPSRHLDALWLVLFQPYEHWSSYRTACQWNTLEENDVLGKLTLRTFIQQF